MPHVSVVIPAFNAEATLARTVASARNQSLADIEILIVDDASSDGTLALARRLAGEDRRVKVIAATCNRGPAAARNLGLDAATGTWIALLDADDAFEPGRLARLVGVARDCGADLLADNLLLESEAGDVEPMLPPGEVASCAPVSAAQFLLGNLPDPARPRKSYGFLKPLLCRAFLEAKGLRYDESLRIGEDYLFVAEALATGARCAIEPSAGYVYSVRDGSISRRLEVAHIAAMLASDERFVKTHSLDADARRAMAQRRRSLRQAISYLSVIGFLKDRAVLRAAGAACRDPAAMRHMRLPIGVRLRRLAQAFG